MDWTDFTVYFWLFPIVVQLLLPLAVSCIVFGVFMLRHVGLNLVGRKKTPLEASTA